MAKIDRLMQLESALLQSDKRCLALTRERDEARKHVLELLDIIAKLASAPPNTQR